MGRDGSLPYPVLRTTSSLTRSPAHVTTLIRILALALMLAAPATLRGQQLPEVPDGMRYAGIETPSGGRFYDVTCDAWKRLTGDFVFFASAEEARAAGYEPSTQPGCAPAGAEERPRSRSAVLPAPMPTQDAGAMPGAPQAGTPPGATPGQPYEPPDEQGEQVVGQDELEAGEAGESIEGGGREGVHNTERLHLPESGLRGRIVEVEPSEARERVRIPARLRGRWSVTPAQVEEVPEQVMPEHPFADLPDAPGEALARQAMCVVQLVLSASTLLCDGDWTLHLPELAGAGSGRAGRDATSRRYPIGSRLEIVVEERQRGILVGRLTRVLEAWEERTFPAIHPSKVGMPARNCRTVHGEWICERDEDVVLPVESSMGGRALEPDTTGTDPR